MNVVLNEMVYTKEGKYDEEKLREDFDRIKKDEKINNWWNDEKFVFY